MSPLTIARTLAARLCCAYLKRRGFYVVAPGSCEMVLSGNWFARGNGREGYLVMPPFPKASLTALSGSIITMTEGWDK